MNHELSHSQHPEEQLTSKNPEVADGDMNFHQALNLLREYAAQEQNFDRAEALNAYIEAANEENPDGRAEAMTSLLKYVSEEKIKLGNTETDGSAEQKMVGLEKIKIALEVERENVEKNTPEQLDQRRAAMELAAAEEKANADKKAEAARREIDTIHNNSDPKKEQLQETNKNEGLPSRLDFNKKADEVARMRFGKTIGGDLGISYDEIINFPDRAKAER
ncbi:MAG: hypothetical protein LBQ11_02845, partial [Candidatus Nomurabacteria bacterium]|nr:hypothetical protein [Candidatus Nomurabacteria bacterium]